MTKFKRLELNLLKDPEVRAEYERMKPEFERKKIQARIKRPDESEDAEA